MNEEQHHRISERVRSELRGALVPLLIALIAWLGSQKLNSIESEIRTFREFAPYETAAWRDA